MDGYDDRAIISKPGIAPDCLVLGYCTLDTFKTVFKAAESLYGDFVGVSLKGETPSLFRSLSMAMLTSETLADSFYLLVKHNPIITNALNFVVHHNRHSVFGFYMTKGLDIYLSLTSAILARALRMARFIHPSSQLTSNFDRRVAFTS
ncbi:MAG: AraC family transcriptional regulator ligand-binding domain-containing protein [Oleispira sp.]|nr:AraC family transcriptional regulator ligand-binding domain-containing protein [Oleispira sp.]